VVAYQYRIDTGYAGTTNRNHDATVTAEVIDTSNPPVSYGVAVAYNPTGTPPGGIRALIAGDVTASVAGMYVRPYPTQGGGPVSPIVNDPLYTSTPPNAGQANVLKRGFMTVSLAGANPAIKGAPVFVALPAGGAAGAVYAGSGAGGTTSPGVGYIAIPAVFMGPADTSPRTITEIAYNL
jgi:hypothetical protein